MQGFVEDIEELTEANEDFRRVLYTGHNIQLVLMTLKSGEEIGEEVHEDRDQFFRFEQGSGVVIIDDGNARSFLGGGVEGGSIRVRVEGMAGDGEAAR